MAQPNCRLASIPEFSEYMIALLEGLANSDWIELRGLIMSQGLFLDGSIGLYELDVAWLRRYASSAGAA